MVGPEPEPLTLSQVDALSNADLTERMDRVLEARERAVYGEDYEGLHLSGARAVQFFGTSGVRAMDEPMQRRSLYAAFEFLLQMQFVKIASGLHNKCVYDDPRYRDTGALPASVLITDAAIRQWSVLASRAAFERFADLLHLLERGERIASSRSRLSKLHELLFRPASRFVYFAPIVQLARRFDDAHRTAAAHGGSSMPRHLLSLEKPDDDLLNRELDLTNVLMNMWRPLIDILNGNRPNYAYGAIDVTWLQAFLSGDEDAIRSELERLTPAKQRGSGGT